MQRKMLIALAQHEGGLTKKKIRIHTSYADSGPVSKAFAELLRGEAPVLVHEPAAATIEWESGGYSLNLRGKNQAEQTIVLVPLDADWNKAIEMIRKAVPQRN